MSDVIDIEVTGADDVVTVNVTETPDIVTVNITDSPETVSVVVSEVGATAAADTELNIMKYQVPANNTLIIRGIRVDTANMVVAVATTAHLLQWGVAIGSTADTLAGTESATVKIRRAVPLGLQSFPVPRQSAQLRTPSI